MIYVIIIIIIIIIIVLALKILGVVKVVRCGSWVLGMFVLWVMRMMRK